MGDIFRRCAHSLGKILRVSHSKTSHSAPQSPSNNYDFLNDSINSALLRDQEILTAESCQRRSVIIEREPEKSFGFSLQSVLIENKDDEVTSGRITYVSKVEFGSPAEKAGIIVGDVIIAIDGEVVIDFTHSELISLIQSKTHLRAIVIYENMAKKVELIAKYSATAKMLREKKQRLAEVENQIDEIISNRHSLGSQGKSIDDAFFDDSVYSDLNSSSFSLKSVESWSFDEASVQFC
uniref:PDZ domain-containing protein n=1 Tax=Panagrolaimus sp. PS1159 TaxID=55785 RepID=A0AC35FJ80_9BILA